MRYLFIQEHGIFDAIEKQYLRRFIFAIYLVLLNHDVFQCKYPNDNYYRITTIQTSKWSAIIRALLTLFSSIIEAYTFNFQVLVHRKGVSVSHRIQSIIQCLEPIQSYL